MYFSDDSDSDESEMMSILPFMLLAEEENRRRERNVRQFVPSTLPSLTRPQAESLSNSNASLDNSLLRLLETGRFSDVQFQVGTEGYCFNCHKAIVGGRSEVLAIAMERRWTENCVENNSMPDKIVIPLPGTDVQVFKVFLKYLYTDKLDREVIEGVTSMDLLLKVMPLSHMYQVDSLLQECITHLSAKINVQTCWKIYKGSRHIAPSLSEKSFKVLCDNIHEAAARNEYLKWDCETVRRILSLERSFISELNLCVALSNWQKFVGDPLEPRSKEIFDQVLLPLIRFPTMNLVTFSRAIGLNVLPQSEIKRLRRYIVNTNPRRRNTSIYSNETRFVDKFLLRLFLYTKCCSTTCKNDGWDSSDDKFIDLIDSRRAEFSIETNAPTTVSALTLHNARKWNSLGVQCTYNLKITFHIYHGQSIMFTENRFVVIGAGVTRDSLIRLVLNEPFQMNPGLAYEFHVLYELLVDSPGMSDENEAYEYDVTWSAMPPYDTIKRKVGHGIILKTNYKVEDDDDDVDHDQTPRWIHSVEFSSKVSQNCHDLCTVS